MSNKKRVLVVPSDGAGVGFYRSIKPHQYLDEKHNDKYDIEINPKPNLDIEELGKYDLIHFHRFLGDSIGTSSLVKSLQDKGVVMVMDIDDYWIIDKSHPIYNRWKNGGYPKIINEIIRTVNCVTTTTETFAKLIRPLNKNVSVIPNAIDLNEKQFKINKTKSDRLRIGWLGGSSHLEDLKQLDGVVKLLTDHNLIDQVQFVICGFDIRGKEQFYNKNTRKVETRPIQPKNTVWYGYEQIFTNNYSSISKEYKEHLLKFTNEEFKGVENEPYRRVWTKEIHSYATNYNLFDISLAPLIKNDYNECKSQLKMIESGAFKKPIIVQGINPYIEDSVPVNLKGGELNMEGNSFIVKEGGRPKEWFKLIKKVIENKDDLDLVGKNLYKLVEKDFTYNKIGEVRKELYDNLLKK
jgi:glycosyltransferase involved in cell wall biosynthesis